MINYVHILCFQQPATKCCLGVNSVFRRKCWETTTLWAYHVLLITAPVSAFLFPCEVQFNTARAHDAHGTQALSSWKFCAFINYILTNRLIALKLIIRLSFFSRIWDTASGQCLKTLIGQFAKIDCSINLLAMIDWPS